MAAYGLAIDPGWLGRDHGDAILEAGEALSHDLRAIAQKIIDSPQMLDEALSEHVDIAQRGRAIVRAMSGDVAMLRDQCRRAAVVYALDLYVAEHGRPDQRVMAVADIDGWAPTLPDLAGAAA